MNVFLSISSIVCIFVGSLLSSSSFGVCYNGWATPTKITYNFSSLSANSDQGTAATLISDPFSVTFKRTDTNFANASVSNITLPFGRYVSLGLCFAGSTDVTLDKVKFDGNGSYNCSASAPLTANSTISTVKSVNEDGSIGTSGDAVATSFNGSTGCSITYLPSPICISDSSQSNCLSGDLVYTGDGSIDNTKGEGKGKGASNVSFKISLLVDLYDGVVIDGGVGKILGVPPIFAMAGDPGAAIHLSVPQSASGGTVPYNASLLFGPDKSLLSATVSQGNGAVGGSPLTHSCQGGNNVAVTGASANFPYERLGSVSTSANEKKGQIFFPAVSSCMSPTSCNSAGTIQIDNIFQSVGSEVVLSCISDSAADMQQAKYGKNYTGGAGSPVSGTDAAKIVRIVDPKNLFETCSTSPCVDTSIATGDGGYY